MEDEKIKSVRAAWKALHKAHEHLESISSQTDEAYWEKHNDFKILLREFLLLDFYPIVNKYQLGQLLGWCSSYRPYEPFRILQIIGTSHDSFLSLKQKQHADAQKSKAEK